MNIANPASRRCALAIALFGTALALTTHAQARGAKTVNDVARYLVHHVRTGDNPTMDKVFDTKGYLARIDLSCGPDPDKCASLKKGAKNLLSFADGPKVYGYQGGNITVVLAQMDGDEGRIVLREDLGDSARYMEFWLRADRKGRPRVVDWIEIGERAMDSREWIIRDAMIRRNYQQFIYGLGLEPQPGDVEALASMLGPPADKTREARIAEFAQLPERYRTNKELLMKWLNYTQEWGEEIRVQTLEAIATHHGDDFETSMLCLEFYARTEQWSKYDDVINRLIERWGEDDWLVAQRDAEAPQE